MSKKNERNPKKVVRPKTRRELDCGGSDNVPAVFAMWNPLCNPQRLWQEKQDRARAARRRA